MKKKLLLNGLLFFTVVSFGQAITTVWSYTLPDEIHRTSPAVAEDETIYIACNLGTRTAVTPPAQPDPNFFAINPDGTLKWSTSISESDFTKPDAIESSPSINGDGSIYMGGKYSRVVFRLDPDNGNRTHDRDIDTRQRDTAPVFASDGTVYICGYDKGDRGIRSLSADLNTENWVFATGSAFNGTPAVASDGTIYAASTDDNIYAINRDGTQKWSAVYGDWVASAIALGADGTVYLSAKLNSDADGVLKAYNPTDGSEKWSVTLTGENVQRGGPAVADDGTVYLGSEGGRMRAYDSTDGSELWSYPLAADPAIGGIEVVPAIDNDGKIYFGTLDGMFYVLNSDGTEAYAPLDLGARINSSATIGADGKIYVGATDDAGLGQLYALQTTATGQASGDWPMFARNAQHTGNVDAINATLSVISNTIEGYKVYPNPVNKDGFYVSTASNGAKSIQIFDISGKRVYSKNIKANEIIRISKLNSGVYILKVEEGNMLATSKLVIK